MRVIAGSARSLKLVTIDSMDTRPTTDRPSVKDTGIHGYQTHHGQDKRNLI